MPPPPPPSATGTVGADVPPASGRDMVVGQWDPGLGMDGSGGQEGLVAWGMGVPTVTTAGNWPLLPFDSLGSAEMGVKMRVLSSSDYYDAENLP